MPNYWWGMGRKAQTVSWMGVHAGEGWWYCSGMVEVRTGWEVLQVWTRVRTTGGAGPISRLILRQRYSLRFGIRVFFVMSSLLSPLQCGWADFPVRTWRRGCPTEGSSVVRMKGSKSYFVLQHFRFQCRRQTRQWQMLYLSKNGEMLYIVQIWWM